MRSGLLACAARTVASCAAILTSPAPLRAAALAAKITAPAMPSLPPTTRIRPRSPLCISALKGGSTSRSHASVTALGHEGSGGGNPISATSTLPHTVRCSRCPRRNPPNVTVVVARTHGACTTPVERSRPDGPSTATTGAASRISRSMLPAAAPRGAPLAPVPSSASTATPQPPHSSSGSTTCTPCIVARILFSRQSGDGSPGNATAVTLTPSDASARAATKPSPPLLPVPQATTTPSGRRPPNSLATAAATARPADSMRTRLGILANSRARRSHSTASAADSTGTTLMPRSPPRS